MPEKRLSLSEAAEAVKKVITAKGGKVNYADLVAQLEAEGASSAVPQIRAAVQSGAIKTTLESQPAGKPIAFYTL